MAETVSRGSASRAELLELKREREIVQEGHRFLDEKRILLARELLARIKRCEALQAAFEQQQRAAHQVLIAATDEAGLEELQVHPPLDADAFGIDRRTRKWLGITLPELATHDQVPDAFVADPALQRRQPRPTAEAYRALFASAGELAGEQAALLRLEAEYRKTQRRVRALEKILLPELDASQSALESALEEQELEEAVRVRLAVR
ncbi:MAG: V-type ATP synthase subunit D [Wenzhouxiangellaceae bacterium]|nr:V-type ATP synthase subunit D [Wenzhouxiangellaceae bacterium]